MMNLHSLGAQGYAVLLPPTEHNCPALFSRASYLLGAEGTDQSLLRHLRTIHQEAKAADAFRIPTLLRSDHGDVILVGSPHPSHDELHRALSLGISTYFDQPGRLPSAQRVEASLAVHEFASSYPEVNAALLLKTLDGIRRTRFTPYSRRVDPAVLQEFLAAQESGVIESGLPSEIKEAVLKVVERTRTDPDSMDVYADAFFLVQSVDFVMNTPGTALIIGTFDGYEISDHLHCSYDQKEEAGEVWGKVIEILNSDSLVSSLHYELHLEQRKMRQEDGHMYANFRTVSRRQKSAMLIEDEGMNGGEENVGDCTFHCPSVLARELKSCHTEFDGYVYQSREATVAETVQYYLERRSPVGLLWEYVHFGDYLPYPLVHAFFFLVHDLYHCADKLLALSTSDDVIAPLWRALAAIPESLIRQAHLQAVIRLLLDIESMGSRDLNALTTEKIITPLRFYYTSQEVKAAIEESQKFHLIWSYCKSARTNAIKHLRRDAPEVTLADLEDYWRLLNLLVTELEKEGRENHQVQEVVETLRRESSFIAQHLTEHPRYF